MHINIALVRYRERKPVLVKYLMRLRHVFAGLNIVPGVGRFHGQRTCVTETTAQDGQDPYMLDGQLMEFHAGTLPIVIPDDKRPFPDLLYQAIPALLPY